MWAVEALGIEGAWVFTPQVYRDDRGAFFEAFRGGEFAADLGYRLDVAQVNCSVSRRGVIRGHPLRGRAAGPGQVRHLRRAARSWMWWSDLRAGSPGFGKWEAVRLDEDSRKAVFLAEGLGHGFMALSDAATVLYLCSTPYAPGREHGVNPLDPAIGISWPLEKTDDGPVLSEPVLSEKDAAAPTLDEALRQGRLPRYEDCVAYAAGLRGQPVPPALD